MSEYIQLPKEPTTAADDGFSGCIIIKAADGTPMIPMLNAKDFQPIVLTCMPTDVILVETQSIGIVEDIDLGESALVCGYGYPETLDSFGGES